MKARIHACPVAGLTLSRYAETFIQEWELASVCLLFIPCLQGIRQFEKRIKATALAYDQVSQMRRKGSHEMKGIEALCQDFVKREKRRRIISFKEGIHKGEAIFIIQHVQIAEDILIFHIRSAERHCLVEYGQGIAHRSVSLVSYHMKRLVIYRNTFAGCHHPEVPDYVVDRDPVEIICLAPRQDSRKNLMLFCGRKNEYRMCRRFLESLEKCVECRLRKHVDLIDDIHAVSSHLRRYAHLLHEGLDVFDTVIRRCIKLMDTIGAAFSKRKAGLALSAWLHLPGRIGAVYHLGEDSRRRGLADATRSAEKIGMSQLTAKYRILQGLGNVILTDKRPEGVRSVFSC